MDKRELKIDYITYQKTFPIAYEELCEKATSSASKAYCIYSNFAVGAAVLLENGVIVTANNQENIAYPSGMCAERIALYYAGSTYPTIAVKALAIFAYSKGETFEKMISPCGACRQVMLEMVKRYDKDFDVILLGQQESVVIKASVLLPFAFGF